MGRLTFAPADQSQNVPAKARPWVRFRREEFGLLAAFPAGQVAMYHDSALDLLRAGAGYESCKEHLLPSIHVETDFHFSAPLMAWLELTRKCNLRCPHCFVEGGSARNNELSTARIMKLLHEWSELGVMSVVLTGGEPTIHPDFLDIVWVAHELGFVVSVATNGMPLTKSKLAKLPRKDIIISVSLDGVHGQGAARGETDYEATTRKLREIRDAGFDTSIMTTTTRTNVHELDRIIEFARREEISLRSVPFMSMGRGQQHEELQHADEDIETAARFWLKEELWERERDPALGLCSGKIFNFLITMVYATRRCMSGRGLCYVDSAGEVYPCSNCSGSKILSGGNLQMDGFESIWSDVSWPIRQITWDAFKETCRGCEISSEHYFCSGRCPSSSYALRGALNQCGVSGFQKKSILRREVLLREHVVEQPAVRVGRRSSEKRDSIERTL